MDVTAIIVLLLGQLWYLLPLLLIVTLIKTPWFKGMMGRHSSIWASGFFSTNGSTTCSRM